MSKEKLGKVKSKQDPTRYEDGTKIPTIGLAQQMGYVNRQVCREQMKKMAKEAKQRRGSKNHVNEFQLGVQRIAPIPPYSQLKSRKLKYWQKKAA